MDHPENRRRPPDSYDPDEPLIVRYTDVIAARNAVAALAVLLRDRQTPLSEYDAQTAMHLLPMGVEPDGTGNDHLSSADDAANFAVALRDRLGAYLPKPLSGPQT